MAEEDDRSSVVSPFRAPQVIPPSRGPDVLVQARVADEQAFLAASGRAQVWGSGLRGVQRVLVGGEPVLESLSTSAGVCTNVLLSPARTRRELAAQGTMWIEDTTVLPAHPCVVLQWRPQNPYSGPFTLAWDIPGAHSNIVSTEGSFLEVEAKGGAPLVFFVTPEPEAWTVEGGADSVHITVRLNLVAGEGVTLATVRDQDVKRIQSGFAALEHLGAHEIRLSGELDEARQSVLALESGVPELDTGFEWSKARLRAAPQPPTGTALLWTVLGRIATGDFAAAKDGVRALVGHTTLGWACGLYACWSGDDRILVELETPLSDWASIVAGTAGSFAGFGVMGHLALASAHDGRRDRAAATAHRREAEALESIPHLPLPAPAKELGGPSDDPDSIAMRLGLGPAHGTLRDPEEGYTLWGTLVTAGARQAGLWGSPMGTASDGAALSALVPAGLLFGILGAEAQAAAGRLHLAPRFPRHVVKFRVANIKLGTALVHVTYEKEGRRHTYRAEQSEGATPINLVLNSRIEAVSIAAAFVDGGVADLDWKTEPGGVVSVQTQLPLDSPRTLTLEVLETGDSD